MGTILVYNPTAETAFSAHTLAPRPSRLEGRALGLLDNGKPNADLLLEELVALLGQQVSFATQIRHRKPFSAPVPAQALAAFAAQGCLVINGVGD